MWIHLLVAMQVAGGVAGESRRASIEAEFVTKAPGKPPERFYGLKLTLRNRGDHPRWFVLPGFGDDRLGDKTVRDTYVNGVPFEAARYVGEGGSVIVVSFHGRDSLRLILLPAHATVRFERYELAAWKDIAAFDAWEASSILVNGRTRLEDWLPYRVASDARLVIPEKAVSEYLDFDRKTYKRRTDYPAGPVRSIRLDVSEKRSVTIKTIPEDQT